MTSREDSEVRWVDYSKLSGFEELYLQDSYVLDIFNDEKEVHFSMEFVLTERHPKYRPPRSGEQYCYKRGIIQFPCIAHVNEFVRQAVVSRDATGETDMGNIDTFLWQGKRYRLAGDWGRLDVVCGNPIVSFC